MKLRSIKRQGGRRPAIPESERKLTTIPHEPPMSLDEAHEVVGRFNAFYERVNAAAGFVLVPSGITDALVRALKALGEHDSH